MKIIGYQTKGNVIRFYLGVNDVKPRYPEEKHEYTLNFSTDNSMVCYKPSIYSIAPGLLPYADYVTGWKDVYVPWGRTVFTNPGGTSIEDLLAHNSPLIVIADVSNYSDSVCGFNKFKGGKDIQKFYLDDEMDPDEVGVPDNYPEKGR